MAKPKTPKIAVVCEEVEDQAPTSTGDPTAVSTSGRIGWWIGSSARKLSPNSRGETSNFEFDPVLLISITRALKRFSLSNRGKEQLRKSLGDASVFFAEDDDSF
eukprot:Gregarina_sp_Poly_1__2680@NODE_1735_length_3436_cov_41_298902_g1136_i0_p4_GENE_NODE_1735_length_3436_cov_41_298902_g1136_i0NODE_1735_length_3436_cov_41_298902_g1136_i0_p4_ORF_typecomplete_len104_score14_91_NODE_1735_length_3436_cov_41_298902_g1136_i024902801